MEATDPQFEVLKNRGNKAYTDSLKPGLAPVIRTKRLQEAHAYYVNAALKATCDDAHASISKNIAASATKLFAENAATLLEAEVSSPMSVNVKEGALSAINHYLKEALPAYGKAMRFGEKAKPRAWRTKSLESLSGFVNQLIEFHREGLKEQQRADSFLWRVFNIFKTSSECEGLWKTLGFCCFMSHMVSSLFHCAVTDISFDVTSLTDERSCRSHYVATVQNDVVLLQKLNNLNEPLYMANQVLSHITKESFETGAIDMDTLEELANKREKLNQIEDDVAGGLALVEALRALLTAQQQLKCSSRNSRTQNDGFWTALDSFRDSALLLRGKHVALEAFIMTKCAEVYKKLLFPRVAATYYTHAVRLGLSAIQSRPALNDAWWFRHATTEVDRRQQQQQMQEEQQKMKDRAPYLKELKDDLDEMKRKSKGSSQSFLRWLYEKHPPKAGSLAEGSLDPEVIRKTFRASLLHYHPDKNMNYGVLWQVLCEEISKELTAKYEVLGCSD